MVALSPHHPAAKPCCPRSQAAWLALGACALCFGKTALADPPSSALTEQAAPTGMPPQLRERVELHYPEEALAEQVHGDVSVTVGVDRSGVVTRVEVTAGPSIFQEAATEAGWRLSFVPATEHGEPVPSTAQIRFHFAPPPALGDEGLTEEDEIVVHGTHPDQESTQARTTLDATDLERAAGQDLAETISQVPGVRIASGTADAAKPIIRGHQERRLLVLNDGVRHESQKWGPDHATEIDPFSAGSISVVRGAAGARFGPDAIGGVILVEPPPLRDTPGVGGKAVTSFASNGLRPYLGLRIDAVPEAAPRLSLRVEGNGAVGASLSAPTYVLGNTASHTQNLGGTVGYTWDAGQVRASWHHHALKAGVFYGVRNSTPSDFKAQLASEAPVNAEVWSTTTTIDRAYQQVTHDVGVIKAELFGDWGTLETTAAFQLNRRREFEQVRDSVTGPQYDFTLRTYSLDALYQHPARSLSSARLEGGVGLQGSLQENVYRGYSLLPNYRSFGGGLFAFERLSLARLDLEVGARVDGLSRTAFFSDDDYSRHVSRGTLNSEVCEELSTTARCPTSYRTGSASVGALLHAVPERFDVKLDLSTASRFPNVDELYLAGNAPSFPVFALGSPNLGVETAWGASLTTGLRHHAITVEASGFGQVVNDYIYFAPDLNEAGEPRFDVTIRGAWPRYLYEPIDALLYGVDGSLSLAPEAPIGLDARGSLVRAVDRAGGAQLVGTPADTLHLALVSRPPPIGQLYNNELRLTTDLVARQSRVSPSADFATAPDGYTLLGLSAETTVGERAAVRVGAEVRNLLNTSYREYTSLLRYYADQPGRDIRVRAAVDF